MHTYFLLVMQNLLQKEKADNDDEYHHYQVNYFIITVALKHFSSSCNKNRLKAVDANHATLQKCIQFIDLYKFRVFCQTAAVSFHT